MAVFPATSVAVTATSFAPLTSVTEQVNVPFVIVAAWDAHVTPATPERASVTGPVIVACVEESVEPVAGDCTVTAGGVLSSFTVTEAGA